MTRNRPTRLELLAFACLGMAVAWAPAVGARDGANDPTLDAGVRAALVHDGRPFAVGVVGELVIAVRTPPGHRVQPIDLPELADAEIVRHHTDVREHPGGGWLHRTRIRVRPLSAAPLAWPSVDLHVESPDGVQTRIPLAERAFEVSSTMRGPEDDRPPFGLRGPEERGRGEGGSFAVGLLSGAALTLALVGVYARRRNARGSRPEATGSTEARNAEPGDVGSDLPGHDVLAPARAALEGDPRVAANLAAAALRELASRRFRIDLRAATTQELHHARPASASPELFSALLRALERHDATRFQDRTASREEVAHDLAQSTGVAAQLTRDRKPAS